MAAVPTPFCNVKPKNTLSNEESLLLCQIGKLGRNLQTLGDDNTAENVEFFRSIRALSATIKEFDGVLLFDSEECYKVFKNCATFPEFRHRMEKICDFPSFIGGI